ncbi:hypothetical protein ACFL6T_02100 [Candidatus Zixiibacteriota bacterium]
MQEENNGQLKIGELPEMQIVSMDDVVLHEDPDSERVAQLIERFSVDGVLKNPPVVARVEHANKFIVLDGANRITTLEKLDIPHVLVQVVDLTDASLVIDCWHHAVEYLTSDMLMAEVELINGVSVQEGSHIDLEDESILCRLIFTDGEHLLLRGSSDLIGRVGQLQAFTRIYHRFAYFDRVSYTSIDHLRQNYRNFTALVSFRGYSKDDLRTITSHSVRVPSGITRVLLPKRALRFNLRLDTLRSGLTLEEKQVWLKETIRSKVADKSIRFYREPTFMFDE